MRFNMDYDHEDCVARLLAKRANGCVAVWPDGSVSWHAHVPPAVHHAADAPETIPCTAARWSDRAARRAYTEAIRQHWRRMSGSAAAAAVERP